MQTGNTHKKRLWRGRFTHRAKNSNSRSLRSIQIQLRRSRIIFFRKTRRGRSNRWLITQLLRSIQAHAERFYFKHLFNGHIPSRFNYPIRGQRNNYPQIKDSRFKWTYTLCSSRRMTYTVSYNRPFFSKRHPHFPNKTHPVHLLISLINHVNMTNDLGSRLINRRILQLTRSCHHLFRNSDSHTTLAGFTFVLRECHFIRISFYTISQCPTPGTVHRTRTPNGSFNGKFHSLWFR